jgi:hypothetical protein
MQTFVGRRNLFGNLVNNSASATLSLADTLINMAEKRILSSRDWPFLWRQYTKTTVASQQAYILPAYTNKPQGIYVTVGGTRYIPEEVSSREEWDELNQVVVTSDSVTHYFSYDGRIELYPIPATTGNTITFNARRIVRDLSASDYVTGTITTVATVGTTTTVTGSGVTWGAGMIGRYIHIDQSNAANWGDNYWYEIATVPTTSTLTLVRTYGGTAITTGSATYTIGECSLIPEPHDMLPVYEALKIYFTSVDPNTNKAEEYGKYFIEGLDFMVRDIGGKESVVITDCDDEDMKNPNFFITL